ncbi:hypothetical protein [Streptomyces sp. NBC_00696]|uniref:hypothetical protein n=1 Tax=Streptomyces sp. NBC_00696 TaxID=2903672 RepID=UPI002E381F45|nr:hypothetical protein [Streptomyces sp. NBC_00696]
MTTAMDDGRCAGTERRRDRVEAAIAAAARDGTDLTASAIARAARVDRSFLYRHRDLLERLHSAAREPDGPSAASDPVVTRASLQADLGNAHARNTRLAARIQQLERRLSEALGEQVWRESGLGAPAAVEELQQTVTRLQQQAVDLKASLEEREAELEAAREANRRLTRALNQRE